MPLMISNRIMAQECPAGGKQNSFILSLSEVSFSQVPFPELSKFIFDPGGYLR